MAIAINGTGTITGISVGGLNDSIITSSELANAAVTSAKLASGVGGKFASYAIICDQKTSGTTGGTFTSGAWRTRDLNTELADADGIVSISSNQFTLGAGSYFIEALAPAYAVNKHQLRIYNSTDAATVQDGQSTYTVVDNQNTAYVSGRVTITGSKAFEIQHQSSASRSTIGLGISMNFDVEIYTVVKIFKEA